MQSDERRLPGDGIPQTLFLLIHHVERRIRAHFRGTNLHWGLRRILQQLWLQDGLSQVELSDIVGSSEASISSMLKHLVAGGWVERRQDDYDYRISRVTLTAKAAALRDAIIEDLRDLDGALRAELGDADTALLEVLLERTGQTFRSLEPEKPSDRSPKLAEHPSPPGDL